VYRARALVGVVLQYLEREETQMDKDKLKMLIELSETIQEADGYIEQYSGFTSTSQKLEFLSELIPCTILSRETPDNHAMDVIIEDDYHSILHHIIKRKWRTSISAAR
jgi:hypothetical protein